MQPACHGRRIPTPWVRRTEPVVFQRKQAIGAGGCRCACLHGNFGVASPDGRVSCTTRTHDSCTRLCTLHNTITLVCSCGNARCAHDTLALEHERLDQRVQILPRCGDLAMWARWARWQAAMSMRWCEDAPLTHTSPHLMSCRCLKLQLASRNVAARLRAILHEQK